MILAINASCVVLWILVSRALFPNTTTTVQAFVPDPKRHPARSYRGGASQRVSVTTTTTTTNRLSSSSSSALEALSASLEPMHDDDDNNNNNSPRQKQRPTLPQPPTTETATPLPQLDDKLPLHHKIVVLGATGQVGRWVVRQLLEEAPDGTQVVAVVRDYDKVRSVS